MISRLTSAAAMIFKQLEARFIKTKYSVVKEEEAPDCDEDFLLL